MFSRRVALLSPDVEVGYPFAAADERRPVTGGDVDPTDRAPQAFFEAHDYGRRCYQPRTLSKNVVEPEGEAVLVLLLAQSLEVGSIPDTSPASVTPISRVPPSAFMNPATDLTTICSPNLHLAR